MFGHVETPRELGAPPAPRARAAAAHRRVHRVRAAAVRADGGADLPQGPGAARARRSREALLVHAVGRLALHPGITNIQASWVKLGPDGVRQALAAGVNDLGGTLMNESISRAAGSEWGQEMPPEQMEELIRVGRPRAAPADDALRRRAGRARARLLRRRAARRAAQPDGARRRSRGAAPARSPRPARRAALSGARARGARRGSPSRHRGLRTEGRYQDASRQRSPRPA